MRLTERLKAIKADAQAIRESMTYSDPRSKGFDPSFGLDARERLVRQQAASYERKQRVAECANLIAEVLEGSRPEWHLKEAMTTSDFPDLMGDVMYRSLLGNFQTQAPIWPALAKKRILKDFRALNLLSIAGGGTELDPVSEREPYPEISFTEDKRQVQVAKYGRRYGISFEMLINDDLEAFATRPQMMAQAARVSEELLVMRQYFDINGPHAGFFTGPNGNIVTANPVLSIAGLQTAYTVLAAQRDEDGNPIIIDTVTLAVVPALEVTAQNILNAISIELREAGGTDDQRLTAVNWMAKKVRLVVMHYQPLVATAETTNNWMLVANPNNPSGRAACEFAYLRGRTDPQMFIKDSNQRQLGGGEVSEMEGDFDTDAIDYKVRHIMGASQGDPKCAVASSGAGS
jgi:hypothetical protein